jgi:CubicO group peptidase (beta-lactamase class C family)
MKTLERLSTPVVLALVLLLFAAPALAERVPNLEEQIDALARPYVDAQHVVGMSVGILRGCECLVRGYGTLKADGDQCPDGDTIYEIGSISKVFTGTLLAGMVNDTTVKIDEPVKALLPDGTVIPKFEDREITLSDLATHTSALPRMPGNFAPKDMGNPFADYTVKQMYAFLARVRLPRRPGETYAYSNLGVGLLGHALSLRAGVDYEALLAKRITRPLAMQSTRIVLTKDMRARLAAGHTAGLAPTPNWDIPSLAGAGGIRSSVSDMIRFATANLSPGATPIGKAMTLAQKPRHTPARGPHLGLGWHIPTGTKQLKHNGQTGGYHAAIILDPALGQAVIVLANTATGEVGRLADDIMRLLSGKKVVPRKFRRIVTVPIEVLDTYVGRYELKPGFVLTVTRAKKALFVQATGQAKFRVFPESATRFGYRAVKAAITFQCDEAGEVTGLVLHQNGRDMPAKRLE